MKAETFDQFYQEVRGQKEYVTRVHLSAETLLAMIRNPGEKRCFHIFGVRVELDETMPLGEYRLVTARQELGLPDADNSPTK